MGSKIHEPTLPPNTQDAPPTQVEKQIVPYPEVPKAMNKGRIRRVTISNHDPHPVRRSPTWPLAIRAVVGVPNATCKLMRIFAISWTPNELLKWGQYLKVLLKKNRTPEAQVKLLSKKKNIASTLTPVEYNLLFTMEIRTAVLPDTFVMPQVP